MEGNRDLRLEWLDPKTLQPNPSNYRRHPEKQKKLLSAMLEEVGWAGALLFNETTGRLIDGHARQEDAIGKGEPEVPVLVGGWSEEDEAKILATLDPIAAMAKQADAIYLELLSGIQTENEDIQEWCDQMIKELGGTVDHGGLTDPDETPGLPEVPTSVAGDLWILGKHRLLCGDSTSATDVSRVLGGVSPLLMVTDPPYGVSYDPEWRTKLGVSMAKRGKVQNDDRADWSEAWALFGGDVAYVWHAGRFASVVQSSLERCDFEVRSQIIWAKNRFAISRGDYHWQHEPCWYVVRKGKTGHWNGDRAQSTLWQIDMGPLDTGHGTQKPVECMKRPIENNSSPGQAIYEPFSGSGTTIIASEMIGRCCHGIEIEPKYVDVAVARWQRFTGKQAVLDGDGRPFDELTEERTSA